MEWDRLVIGGRVRVRLPSGSSGGPVEVTGQLLGRDTSKIYDPGSLRAAPTENEFRAVVRLDDGTIVLAELGSIVGRAGEG